MEKLHSRTDPHKNRFVQVLPEFHGKTHTFFPLKKRRNGNGRSFRQKALAS
jgi:hypothetical protein